MSQYYCPVACGWLHLPQCSGPGQGPGPEPGPAATGNINSNRLSKLHPRPTPLCCGHAPRPTASFSLHGTLMMSGTTAGVYLQYGMRCAALRMLACCTLMHQGAVGVRGGVRATIGVGTSARSPTPLPRNPQPVSHSVTLLQVKSSQSVSQSGRTPGQSGRLSLSGGKECAAHLSSCTPPVLPSGWCQWCLGCLENFSETPGHPVCFGLCSTHHTPSAHPHHTTPHHSTAITTTVQHALHVHTYPAHPCTLAGMPGCASARSDVAWLLLRDKASPAAMPWGSPKAAQGTCRFACVLVKSRKAAPPLPKLHLPST